MFRRSGYRFADKNVRQSMILEHVPIPKERTCSSVLCRKSRTYSDGAGGRQGKLPLPAKRGEVNNHTFDAFAVDEARRPRMTRPEGPTDVPSCWPAARRAILGAFTVMAAACAGAPVQAQGKLEASYAVNLTADNRPDAIRMALNGGAVKDLIAEPPTPFAPDRVPITDAHVRGVVDPLTAGLIPMGASGDMLSPEACHRTLPIFDGRQRYDLVLSFKRMERVRAERGYQGPAVVCMVVYQPLAGHRPERAAIRHLAQSRDMEIALAPVAGTRVLAPFRILIPTLIGPAVLQATQFVSVAQA